MINAVILTNLEESYTREQVSEHLQMIQKAAGKINLRIVKAIVERTGCEMPYFEQVLDSLKHYAEEYDAVIVDDTFGLSDTEAYDTLKEFMDDMNIPVYFYQYEEIFLPDDNDKFAYGDEPFEVCELRFDDNISSFFNDVDSFGTRVNSYWEIVEGSWGMLPTYERCERKIKFFAELNHMAEDLMYLAEKVSDSLEMDWKLSRGTL